MSVSASNAVWQHSKSKGNERLVALALADIADDRGVVRYQKDHQSQESLAEKINTVERVVRRAIGKLEAHGELVVARRQGRESYYQLCGLDDEMATAEEAREELRQRLLEEGEDPTDWTLTTPDESSGVDGAPEPDAQDPPESPSEAPQTPDTSTGVTPDESSGGDGADPGHIDRSSPDTSTGDTGPHGPVDSIEGPETKTQRSADAGGAATAPITAQDLLADHIDACNTRPPDRVVGHTAREIAQLLDEGINPEAIRAGLAKLRRKALHPSTLPSLANEHLNAPKRGHAKEQIGTFTRTERFL